MKPYAHQKTGHTTHPHNTCDICSGQPKSKKRTRQEANRQIEDQFKREYMLEIPKDTKPYYTCMDCVYFLGGSCTTSPIEAKYGSGSTPACKEDFKLKEK